jgi:hypothetical protein
MTDAGYVIAGWLLTGVVLGGYTATLALRLRRARKSLPGPGGDSSR